MSRKYEVMLQANGWTWWRSGPEFSQRYAFTFADQGDTILSRGEISHDGTNWEPDLNLTYRRIK
ncbi:hypothetical protein [Hymenobacter sp. BT491]|uniref:hypothetical protein n=1 Tax=Hymenobacter sp. BT491 TaxID=2766779 RepID=UPI0019C2908A|nr:hypothetical protein [Hymenobacter sp. BT491]MBC6992347.1 hypothetical protein [Hymenobacter sp. BT491]